MSEWMLARAELAKIVAGTDLVTPTGYLLLGEGDVQIVAETITKLLENTAKAQAYKIVAWLGQPCDSGKHGYMEGYTRMMCDGCMRQLRKEVGLCV